MAVKDSKPAAVKPPAVSTSAPTSTSTAPSPGASVSAPPVVESSAIIDVPIENDGAWVDVDVPVSDGAPIATETAPSDAVSATTASGTTTPELTTDPRPDATLGSADPAAPVASDVPVTPAAPVAPANLYDANEKIHVMEGVEWSRSQLVDALNVGVGAKSEADSFRSVFGCTAAEAQNAWKPLVDDLRADPNFADYLQRAIDHYKTETAAAAPQPAAQQQYAQLDPALRNELAEIRAWKQQQDGDRQRSLYAEHERTAFAQHPILQTDPQIYAMVAQRTQYRIANGNPHFTLLDGVRELSPWLQEQSALRAARVAASAPSQVIPVLNTGAGAAPAATRSTTRIKPKQFATLDDATADWLQDGARSAGFN